MKGEFFSASRNGILLDTNLLVLWVIGSVDPAGIETNRRTRSYTHNDFLLLGELLRLRQGPILTTPHILAETSNLVADALKGGLRAQAMNLLGQLILAELDERHIPGRQIVQGPMFLDLGLTDSAILELKALSCSVLTSDAPLYARLSAAGVAAFNFNHIRGQLS